MTTPAPLVPPPGPPVAVLHAHALPTDVIPTSQQLVRIHRTVQAPLFFGTGMDCRFQDPAQGFGVCYFGESDAASFAETFLRTVGIRSVSQAALAARAFSSVDLTRALRVVDLHGPGLARVGTTAAVATVYPYDIPNAWAAALYDHPARPDGIRYRCRHDSDEMALALFDRAAAALVISATQAMDSDPARLAALLDRWGLGLTT
jgi:hypothetical protein